VVRDRILLGLNAQQKRAVKHTEGPLLIFAGAGSGKTRVIVHRVAHLINKGVSPREILCLTFTNKAAGEMKDRLRAILGEDEVPV
jgi:DNA helicase-2/ATP-dependent DNA helicase PcrA